MHKPVPLAPQEQLEANCREVELHDANLAAQFKMLPLVNLQLARNNDGYLIGQAWDVVTQQWVPLCNPQDPWGEAEADAEKLWTPNARVFCLLGLGLGYFASAIARRLLPYQRLGIFETRPQHYAAAMRAVPFQDTLVRNRVQTYIGDDLPGQCRHWWLTLDGQEKFHISAPFVSGFAAVLDAAVYQQMLGVTAEMSRYHLVGLATWAQFGPMIGDNDLGNLPEYLVTPGLHQLKDAWQDKPAVCIAAGPSLQKNLHVLTDPAYRDRVAVITVGTTYALVRALGINPDVVCTIDFQKLNWTDQFWRVPLDDRTPLVYLHSTYPETVRRWPGPRFVALNGSDTVTWMSRFTEEKPSAAQVQTVAHLNLLVAYWIGADPIMLIGQDLSMPKNAHHAMGARAQDTNPADNLEAHIEAADYTGASCWTRHSLLSMRTVFSQIIAAHPEHKVLNCTEGGLAIDGAPNMPLLETLSNLPHQEVILKGILSDRYDEYQHKTDWTAVRDGLHTLNEQWNGLVALANRAEMQYVENGTFEREAYEETLLGVERDLGSYPLAFAQIVVRSFPLVETIAKIPPPVTAPEKERRDFQLQRIEQLLACVRSQDAAFRRLLRQVTNRVQDLMPDSLNPYHQLIRRQSYHALRKMLSAYPEETGMTAMFRLLWHQQCYRDLLALCDHLPNNGTTNALRDRCARLLERHERAMQPLRHLYYRPVDLNGKDPNNDHSTQLAHQRDPGRSAGHQPRPSEIGAG